jgi:hypothetical protein
MSTSLIATLDQQRSRRGAAVLLEVLQRRKVCATSSAIRAQRNCRWSMR